MSPCLPILRVVYWKTTTHICLISRTFGVYFRIRIPDEFISLHAVNITKRPMFHIVNRHGIEDLSISVPYTASI